jgi:hypothetical protein
MEEVGNRKYGWESGEDRGNYYYLDKKDSAGLQIGPQGKGGRKEERRSNWLQRELREGQRESRKGM